MLKYSDFLNEIKEKLKGIECLNLFHYTENFEIDSNYLYYIIFKLNHQVILKYEEYSGLYVRLNDYTLCFDKNEKYIGHIENKNTAIFKTDIIELNKMIIYEK